MVASIWTYFDCASLRHHNFVSSTKVAEEPLFREGPNGLEVQMCAQGKMIAKGGILFERFVEDFDRLSFLIGS